MINIKPVLAKVHSLIRILLIKAKSKNSVISFFSYINRSSMVEIPVFLANGTELHSSTLGCNVNIKKNARLWSTHVDSNVTIGTNSQIYGSRIGSYTYAASSARVVNAKIGKFCSIAHDVVISPGLHPLNFVSTSPAFFSKTKQCGITFAEQTQFNELGAVEIGNDVWIGDRVVIKENVIVGNGAVIGTGAIVVKDVPPYAIVGGVPAKLIRYRFDEITVERLQNLQWWDWTESKLRDAHKWFSSSNIEGFLDYAESLRSPL